MADWYYTKEGQQKGPVSAGQLRQMAQSGELLPTDMVFKEGSKEWIAASSVKDLFAGVGSSRSSVSAAPARSEPDQGSLAFGASGHGGDDDDGYRSSRRGSGGFGDILMFRRMISPFFIMLLFWLGVAGAILGGLGGAVFAFMGGQSTLVSLGTAVGSLVAIPFVILYVRFITELMILTFRIYDRLTEIKTLLEKQARSRS